MAGAERKSGRGLLILTQRPWAGHPSYPNRAQRDQACQNESKPRTGAMFIVEDPRTSSFVFQRRGEDAYGMIRSRPRRAAEKQKESIEWRGVL